jgi:hypothetical protein
MLVYQKNARERIRKQMRKTMNLISRAVENKTGEADTRLIVVNIISDMLGWCKFQNLTGEYAIKGGFADFVLLRDDQPAAVIEVKRAGLNLNDNHVRQARDYAFNEGLEWVILTNADAWWVYRASYARNKAPELTNVLKFNITDDAVKPAEKVELLYLLSEEASRKGEMSDYASKNLALSGASLAELVLSTDVLNRLRIAIGRDYGHKVSNSEIAEAICENVLKDCAEPEKCQALLRRVRAEERK